jgi:hypothetical protein
MLIYSEYLTPRLRYAAETTLAEFLPEVRLTRDSQEFIDYSGGKIWYAHSVPPAPCLHIEPSGFLKEEDIRRMYPGLSEWNGMPVYFPVHGGSIPFDIFSAVFFVVCRFEEYWSFQSDQFGRFTSESSLQKRDHMLHIPIVDMWRDALSEMLEQTFGHPRTRRAEFRFVSTIDVDHAYAYLHKGFQRTTGALVRDLLLLRRKNLSERLRVLGKKEEDPYDTYQFIIEKHRQYGLEVMFFFLMADLGEYDRGHDFRQRNFRELIARISKHHVVGIHPGMGTYRRYNALTREKARLEQIIGKGVTESRQHYLHVRFRSTYKLLRAAGIKHDYSLGYADHTGFRAGTCRPFNWFDVKKNEVTPLVIHPLTVMDATLKNYMQLTPEAGLTHMTELLHTVKKYRGEFTLLWHNETLHASNDWKEWRPVWEEVLRLGAAASQA